MINLSKGLYTALITPFKNGKVDYSALEKLLEFQIKEGVEGVVLCGTTGESATIEEEEKFEIAKFSLNIIKKRIKVIVGTGSNNTAYSVNLTKKISELNPDGFLIVTPYYNKANEEGLFLHFKNIANSTTLPIILYNVPARTNVNLKDSIIAKLIESIPNIVGIKDASGDLSRVPSLKTLLKKEILLFSGEDATALAFNASGGNGIISVASNIVPKLCAELQKQSLLGNITKETLKLQETIFQISSVLFSEVNPIPVKYALYLMKMCENEYRLPLCEPSNLVKKEIENMLFKYNICK